MNLNFISLALLFILVFSFTCPQTLAAQTFEMDERNHELMLQHHRKSADSVFYYAGQLQGSKSQIRRLFGQLSVTTQLYNQDRLDTCIQVLNLILDSLDKYPQPKHFIFSEQTVGKSYEACADILRLNVFRRFYYIHRNRGKYNEALDYLLKRKAIVDHLPDQDNYQLRNKVSVEKDLAGLHNALGKVHKAIAVLKAVQAELKAIKLDPQDPFFKTFELDKIHFLVELGSIYMSLIKENVSYGDTAHFYFDTAYEACMQIDSTDRHFKRSHLFRKAFLYYEQKEFRESLAAIKQCKKYYQESEPTHLLPHLIALDYSALEIPDSAVLFARQFLVSETFENETFWAKLDMYNILARNYVLLGQTDSAYYFSQITLALTRDNRDERSSTSERISELEISEYQQFNEEILTNHHKAQTTLLLLSVLGVSALLIVILVFHFKRRRYKKEFAKLQQQFNTLNNDVMQEKSLLKSRPNQENSQPESTTKPEGGKLKDTITNQILEQLIQIENSTLFLNENFNLQALAKLLKTNTSYLSKVINQEKGKSFTNYLAELRINHLLKELESNPVLRRYSIEALGNSIGYSNSSSFTRTFKKHMQVTPSQYLKAHFEEFESATKTKTD